MAMNPSSLMCGHLCKHRLLRSVACCVQYRVQAFGVFCQAMLGLSVSLAAHSLYNFEGEGNLQQPQ